jgi:hypothetical protein
LSIDHKVPQSQGGSDYPSNVRAAHQGCNKARRDKGDGEFKRPASLDYLPDSTNDSPSDGNAMQGTRCDQVEPADPPTCTDSDIPSVNASRNGAVNHSRPHSLLEGKGREGNREGNRDSSSRSAETLEPPVGGELSATAKPRGTTLEPIRIDVEQACTLLADLIEGNGTRRPSITQGWRDAARLMLDRDHIALADVLGAIRWSQADEFWRCNVLSMPKLRKQYPTLRLQAQRGQAALAPTGTDGYRPSTADRRVADALALAEELRHEEQQ